MFPPIHFDDEGGEAGQDYYLKPMNCPFHILIFRVAAAELPRAAAAAVRVRHGVPLREERRRPRPHPGAGHDAGRRPHLHDEGEHGRGARVAPRLRARPAGRLRPRRLLPRAVHEAAGQGGRHATRSGTRPPRRCARRRRPRTSSSCSTRAAARSTARRSRCRPATPSAARGRCPRSSSTSRRPSASSIEYVGADNERHRPIMIHRALFGSIERFFGVLVEHYAGAFPAWLAPEQVRVLPVRSDHHAYAARVADRLRADGFRADARRGRRAARRPDPQGQAREAPVHPRRRRRRRRGRHRRRQRPRQRPARARRPRRRLRRPPRRRGRGQAMTDVCARDAPHAGRTAHTDVGVGLVPLDHLWATWRSAYVGQVVDIADAADARGGRRAVAVRAHPGRRRRGGGRGGRRAVARRPLLRAAEPLPVHGRAPDGAARSGRWPTWRT